MRKRIFALALACVLCIAALPVAAEASTEVSGSWSSEKFWRSNRFTYPFVFDETLIGCTGFTLDYEIVEVTTGTIGGNYIFEVYICDTRDKWKSVDTFYLEDQKATVEVALKEPVSIKAVAVICQKKADFSYSHALTVRDAIFRGTASGSQGANVVSGSWAEEGFLQNNRAALPFEFDETVENCTGFTLIYEIRQVTEGSLDGKYRYAVYVRTTDGQWESVQEFVMDGYSTAVDVSFPEKDVDAVAVFCLKNANLTYSYEMSITDPVTE